MRTFTMTNPFVLLTCEHASNLIPHGLRNLMPAIANQLTTHRAYDIGAQAVAETLDSRLRRHFPTSLVCGTVSRLLIDLNRSLDNKDLYSEYSLRLSKMVRDSLIVDYYNPFRIQCKTELMHWPCNSTRLHLSIHSFTPQWNEQTRECDIGLLFDPDRNAESVLATQWKNQINAVEPGLRCRFNYPYTGVADGHTSALRKEFSDPEYLGLEVEINQSLLTNQPLQEKVADLLYSSFIKCESVSPSASGAHYDI